MWTKLTALLGIVTGFLGLLFKLERQKRKQAEHESEQLKASFEARAEADETLFDEKKIIENQHKEKQATLEALKHEDDNRIVVDSIIGMLDKNHKD